MALTQNQTPSSLRKPMDTVRFSGSFPTSTSKPYLVASAVARADVRVDSKLASTLKARFVKLPQEPEDARMTGVTRSLNRRLLGLNLRGSLGETQSAPGLIA